MTTTYLEKPYALQISLNNFKSFFFQGHNKAIVASCLNEDKTILFTASFEGLTYILSYFIFLVVSQLWI